MATEYCTASVRIYNGSSWSSKGTATDWYGYAGFGGGRGLEISFTPTKSVTSQFHILIPQCVSASAGSNTWYYRLQTTKVSGAPSTATGSVAKGSASIYSNVNTYTNAQFQFTVSGVTAGTKYYFYVYSTNPSTSTATGYVGNSSTSGYIDVRNYYTEQTYTLKKPTSCTFNGTAGFYSGNSAQTVCTVRVNASTSYPYIYASDSASGSFAYKGKASSGYLDVGITASTSSSNYISKYFVACDTQLSSLSGVTSTYSRVGYVPRLACRIYNGSSTLATYDTYNHSLTTDLYTSPYGLLGFTTSSTSKTPTYAVEDSPDGDGWHDDMDGGTFYAIHYKASSSSTATKYYYLGTSTKNSTTQTTTTSAKYLYGKGTTSGGTTSTSYSTTPSTANYNTSYIFQGWASSASTTVYSTSYSTAFASYSTIYAVYKKAGSDSTSNVYYYRGTNDQQTGTKTITTADAYRYGTGSTSGGSSSTSYSTPTTTHYSDTSYVFQGWATSSSSSTVASTTASTAWGSSSTIYGVYKKTGSSTDSTVYYYCGNNTQNSITKTTTVADTLCYGTGTTSGGGTTTSYGTITTDCAVSGWTFLGFSSNASTQSSTSSATSLFDAGNTTIYGTYSKTDTMTYYPENGNSSSTVSATNYRYGTGSVTDNSPAEPTVTYDGYTLLGWATSTTGTADTWDNQYDSGIRTVYAIWERDGNVYLGVNGEWILVKTYYGINGQWVPINFYYGASNTWKE